MYQQIPVYIFTQIPAIKKASIKGIKKGVSLRLRRICSSDNDYTARSKECTKYLLNRGHNLKLVQLMMSKKHHGRKHGNK